MIQFQGIRNGKRSVTLIVEPGNLIRLRKGMPIMSSQALSDIEVIMIYTPNLPAVEKELAPLVLDGRVPTAEQIKAALDAHASDQELIR